MVNVHADTRRGTRSRFVGVKFTDDEYHRLSNFATDRDLKVAVLVRASVLDAVKTEHAPATFIAAAEAPPVASSRELVDLRAALNKVGGNINQIARLCNQEGIAVIPVSDSQESFTEVFSQTLEVLHAIQDQLGGTVRAT